MPGSTPGPGRPGRCCGNRVRLEFEPVTGTRSGPVTVLPVAWARPGRLGCEPVAAATATARLRLAVPILRLLSHPGTRRGGRRHNNRRRLAPALPLKGCLPFLHGCCLLFIAVLCTLSFCIC